ncbi:Hypothetical_protein [Hexamita inflata]|uniref:Hypothetical_protein n=1 Tax=Hexamita inflata TaxID=28002 RepID=A0AA86V316_9EUKA|nr:Hypothetical protein HINF_LOCUS61906 [Hexamita inflata]
MKTREWQLKCKYLIPQRSITHFKFLYVADSRYEMEPTTRICLKKLTPEDTAAKRESPQRARLTIHLHSGCTQEFQRNRSRPSLSACSQHQIKLKSKMMECTQNFNTMIHNLNHFTPINRFQYRL